MQMKQSISIYFTLLCLAFSFSLNAQQIYKFNWDEMDAGKIENSAPQIFIFNKQGKLIHYSDRFLPSLMKSLDNIEVLSNSDQTLADIKELTGASFNFEAHDLTLVYTAIHPDIGPCPPCDKQAKVLKNVLSKTDKKIDVHEILMIDFTN